MRFPKSTIRASLMRRNRKRGLIVGGAIAAAAVFLAGFSYGYREPAARPFHCDPHAPIMADPR
jgi:hypothetical protein